MALAYEKKQPLYLSTKNTILKKYDGRWVQCLQYCLGIGQITRNLNHLGVTAMWPKYVQYGTELVRM